MLHRRRNEPEGCLSRLIRMIKDHLEDDIGRGTKGAPHKLPLTLARAAAKGGLYGCYAQQRDGAAGVGYNGNATSNRENPVC